MGERLARPSVRAKVATDEGRTGRPGGGRTSSRSRRKRVGEGLGHRDLIHPVRQLLDGDDDDAVAIVIQLLVAVRGQGDGHELAVDVPQQPLACRASKFPRVVDAAEHGAQDSAEELLVHLARDDRPFADLLTAGEGLEVASSGDGEGAPKRVFDEHHVSIGQVRDDAILAEQLRAVARQVCAHRRLEVRVVLHGGGQFTGGSSRQELFGGVRNGHWFTPGEVMFT